MNLELAKKIEAMVKEKFSERGTAFALALMEHGELIAEVAVGTTDGKAENPASPRDLYNVGSVSKVYCAAAVMVLVQQGLLKLDDPVVMHLPRFTMLDERYKDITVRMTLCHTSGLPGTYQRVSAANVWIENYHEELYEYFANSYLKAAPGEWSTYCNDGFTLAEMVVAEVSGMDYPDFVKKYITDPIGAFSTCYGNYYPEDRKHVEVPGRGVERLMVSGAGGTATDMFDCAKFGNIFLGENPVLTAESMAEMALPHGRTNINDDPDLKTGVGLGWDAVSYEPPPIDLGPSVLAKGGSTTQFHSYLLVVPAYGISAACSTTPDAGINQLQMLVDVIALYLKEKGIATEKKPTIPGKPIRVPVEHFQQYAGKYICNSGMVEVSFSDTDMLIYSYSPSGERTMAVVPAMQYTEAGYTGAMNTSASFTTARGKLYLVQNSSRGSAPMFTKIEDHYPALDETWVSRVGRKYIASNNDYRNIGGFRGAAIQIRSAQVAPGILFICNLTAPQTPGRPPAPTRTMPFITHDAKTGKMFIDCAGSARDINAPLAYEENGIEYIYIGGLRFIDASAVEEVTAGEFTIADTKRNLVCSIPKGVKVSISGSEGVIYAILNANCEPIFDSKNDKSVGAYDGGFLIVAGPAGASVHISLS
ncbi:MAG: beta-lactamase family protein [Symbiobacteriaceae bacterium]|nr:beta-lactamase family protein [Symbiobacteriaceae bacterium]